MQYILQVERRKKKTVFLCSFYNTFSLDSPADFQERKTVEELVLQKLKPERFEKGGDGRQMWLNCISAIACAFGPNVSEGLQVAEAFTKRCTAGRQSKRDAEKAYSSSSFTGYKKLFNRWSKDDYPDEPEPFPEIFLFLDEKMREDFGDNPLTFDDEHDGSPGPGSPPGSPFGSPGPGSPPSSPFGSQSSGPRDDDAPYERKEYGMSHTHTEKTKTHTHTHTHT